jgi:hypothetical protein
MPSLGCSLALLHEAEPLVNRAYLYTSSLLLGMERLLEVLYEMAWNGLGMSSSLHGEISQRLDSPPGAGSCCGRTLLRS